MKTRWPLHLFGSDQHGKNATNQTWQQFLSSLGIRIVKWRKLIQSKRESTTDEHHVINSLHLLPSTKPINQPFELPRVS